MAPQSTPPPPVNELWFIDAQAMFQVIYVEMSYESFKKCWNYSIFYTSWKTEKNEIKSENTPKSVLRDKRFHTKYFKNYANLRSFSKSNANEINTTIGGFVFGRKARKQVIHVLFAYAEDLTESNRQFLESSLSAGN